MHTPDHDAMKCWAGGLGEKATHALVYAQLYTPDGVCHGLHQFIVPVRDAERLLSFLFIVLTSLFWLSFLGLLACGQSSFWFCYPIPPILFDLCFH